MDDERTLRTFDAKRMAAEVAADSLGGEWQGYRVLISGGNDKQGFPVKQEVLTPGRVLSTCYWVRGIPATDQGGLEEEGTDPCTVALGVPISGLSTWLL